MKKIVGISHTLFCRSHHRSEGSDWGKRAVGGEREEEIADTEAMVIPCRQMFLRRCSSGVSNFVLLIVEKG